MFIALTIIVFGGKKNLVEPVKKKKYGFKAQQNVQTTKEKKKNQMNPNQCTNPITKSLCILFDRETGGCLREGNEDQVRPPSWCPMKKDTSDHTSNPKVLLGGKYASVTRASCLNCGKEFDLGYYHGPHGRKKFCSYTCRWDFHNKRRVDAEKDLTELLERLWDKYGFKKGG